MARLFAALVIALLVGAAPAGAAPIVFDFEDGLQGWELHGAATRVQTQILGGEWAIFGDGVLDPCCWVDLIENEFITNHGTHMSLTIDLTEIRSITLEQFLIEGDGVGPSLFTEVDLIENIFVGAWFVFEPVSPGNPNLWAVDLSDAVGIRRVEIVWTGISGAELAPIVAFIDNVTFHPVPEPATAVLLGLGLVALAAVRRLSWKQ
jgi:hypothetical protein